MRITRRAGVGLAVSALTVSALALPAVAAVTTPVTWSADDATLTLAPAGTYRTGVFDASAQEIVAYHARTKRLFTVNAELGAIEVLDARSMTKIGELDAEGVATAAGAAIPAGTEVNSVAVRPDGLGVIAVEAPTRTDPGWLVLFDAVRLRTLGAVQVGAQPDMVAISDDGRYAVTANEGEPDDAYAVDPEGSISVVRLSSRVRPIGQWAVRTADFHAFEAALPDGVRVFGPTVNTEHPVSANLEPEYVAIAGRTAYVTLQENNAIAVVDLRSAAVTRIMPLGSKDWGAVALDPSDKDGAIDLRTFPGLRGLYQPDSIAAYTVRGRTYLVTANEGDAREWGDYEEGARVKDLGGDGLPPICADSPLAGLTGNADLGRLHVTTASGLSADGSCYEELYTFGARSFSIWTTSGELVYDSGSDFEEITAQAEPASFNSNHSESNLEGRSDDKGPEPEGVTVGRVGNRTYAFVGFERVGGVIAYDVTDPRHASAVTYVNNRDFAFSVEDGDPLDPAGDLGPEGVTFIPAHGSPTRQPMLAVANEVSGTTTLFSIGTVGHHGHR